jgi:hypothetical protein
MQGAQVQHLRSPIAKAIVGALLAGLTALGTALTDDIVTAAEWVGVAVATVGTYAGVWRVPNRPRG